MTRSLALAALLWAAGTAAAQSFHFFPKSGVVRSVLGGEDAIPFPGGPPGQDFVVYPDGKTAVAAVGWDALILRKCDVISGHTVNWQVPVRIGSWPGFRGPVTISHVDGLLRFGQPDGDVVLIHPDTFAVVGRASTGRKELVRLVGPAPPPVVADFNPPVTFGTGNRHVYLAFDPTDDVVPPADKAWLCRETVAYFERTCGVNFKVSTRRPPLPGPGKPPLKPRQYGTVRVLPSDQWFNGMFVGTASLSPAESWNQNAIMKDGGGERAVWVWSDKAAYRRQYGREAMLRTICHEICHAVGGLPDLYKRRPDGTYDLGPPDRLMSGGGGWNPLDQMVLIDTEKRAVQNGANAWMGGKAGGWEWNPN